MLYSLENLFSNLVARLGDLVVAIIILLIAFLIAYFVKKLLLVHLERLELKHGLKNQV